MEALTPQDVLLFRELINLAGQLVSPLNVIDIPNPLPNATSE